MYENIFNRTNPGVVDHVLDTLLGEDPMLKHVRDISRRAGLPEIEVSVEQGKMLELLVKLSGAEEALEIGTLAGYSTLCIAKGLGHAGRVTTIEYEAKHFYVADDNFKDSPYYDHIEMHCGDALTVLGTLRHRGFDFVFIDADKERNADYLLWATQYAVPGATIIVDNVIREGRVLDAARPEKLAFIKTVAALQSQGRLEASVVQTVGSKTWDGFVLARKTDF